MREQEEPSENLWCLMGVKKNNKNITIFFNRNAELEKKIRVVNKTENKAIQ